MSVKKMVTCAMCLALAVVTGFIRLYQFPFGGSVTLCSMLFVMLPGWFFGPVYGCLTGLCHGLINFLIEPYFMSVPQFLFDYVLAFSVMGAGGFFRKKPVLWGYFISVAARWIIATIAGLIWVSLGFVAWEGWSPLPYSAAYNGAYIFTEAVLTAVLLAIPSMRKALERIKAACCEESGRGYKSKNG